jgi:SPP1 gp7 family putative phage head morphogenesis protein
MPAALIDSPILQDVLARWGVRLSLNPDEMAALGAAFRGFAFTMVDVWNTDFLDAMAETIGTAIKDGLSEAAWVENAQEVLDRFGAESGLQVYSGERFSAAYADLVFRQNVMSAYAAASYSVMFSPEMIDEDPYWLFATAGDDRVRETHAALGGLVFRKDDQSSLAFLPPCSWNCRCQCIPLSQDDLDAGGYDVSDTQGLEIPDPDFVGGDSLVPGLLRKVA